MKSDGQQQRKQQAAEAAGSISRNPSIAIITALLAAESIHLS